MAPTVNMHQAKSQLSKLVSDVESGLQDEVIISRNGKPVARIVPLEDLDAPPVDVSKRLGIAEGMFGSRSFEELQEGDEEIARLMLDGPLFPPERAAVKTKKSA
jgi:prevent-host-death family protein